MWFREPTQIQILLFTPLFCKTSYIPTKKIVELNYFVFLNSQNKYLIQKHCFESRIITMRYEISIKMLRITVQRQHAFKD